MTVLVCWWVDDGKLVGYDGNVLVGYDGNMLVGYDGNMMALFRVGEVNEWVGKGKYMKEGKNIVTTEKKFGSSNTSTTNVNTSNPQHQHTDTHTSTSTHQHIKTPSHI